MSDFLKHFAHTQGGRIKSAALYVSLIALFILCPLFSKKLCFGDLNSFNKFISSIEFEILRNEIQDKLDLVNRNKCIITRNQFDAFDILERIKEK